MADSLGIIYRENLWSDTRMDELGSSSISVSLLNGKIKDFVKILNRFFLDLDHEKFPIRDENTCQNYVQLILLGRHGIISSEVSTSHGCNGIEIITSYFHWILGIKFLPTDKENDSLVSRKIEEAMRQLIDKRIDEHYGEEELSGRTLIRLAMVYSEKQREFVAWEEIEQ